MRRPWMLPLVPLYAGGLAVKNLLLERGVLPEHRLRGAVVSVGSLSAGGAGKTPVTMMIAEMLRDAGFTVDVLSRGYGRTGRGVERVSPNGDAARFGDEPTLMARRLGVPVWVGNDRFAAGLAAEAASGGRVVHVLDDGFQHRRVLRKANVVLLTQADARDWLLPVGNLREEAGALRRADIVVLREGEAEGLRGLVPGGKVVWVVRRRLAFAGVMPTRPVVFCGIARPQGFVAMLAEAGVTGVEVVRFRDHHGYRARDVSGLVAAARRTGADGFCTTEKDAVKLSGAMRRELEEVGPVAVAELRVELVEGGVGDLVRLIGEECRGS